MLGTNFDMYTLQSLFTWILFGFPTCEIALFWYRPVEYIFWGSGHNLQSSGRQFSLLA